MLQLRHRLCRPNQLRESVPKPQTSQTRVFEYILQPPESPFTRSTNRERKRKECYRLSGIGREQIRYHPRYDFVKKIMIFFQLARFRFQWEEPKYWTFSLFIVERTGRNKKNKSGQHRSVQGIFPVVRKKRKKIIFTFSPC